MPRSACSLDWFIRLSLIRLDRSIRRFAIVGALVSGRPRTDRARVLVVPARRAVLAAEVDDLQVALSPLLAREELLQIALGLLDVLARRQSPACGEAVDVRVDREGRLAERLRS